MGVTNWNIFTPSYTIPVIIIVRGCNRDKFNGSIESSQKCSSCFLKINCPSFNLNVRRWMIFNQPAVNFLFTGRKQIMKNVSVYRMGPSVQLSWLWYNSTIVSRDPKTSGLNSISVFCTNSYIMTVLILSVLRIYHSATTSTLTVRHSLDIEFLNLSSFI